MAKVTAPLLSMDARGQIGKTLVFIGWKGIKSVRQYVVPANPNTAAQQAQRLFMASCVATWKVLTALTKAAWGDWAPFEPKAMSGFNSATKGGVAAQKSNAAMAFAQTVVLVPGDVKMDGTCDLIKVLDQAPVNNEPGYTFDYGIHARDLAETQALAWGTTEYAITVTGVINGTQYYGRVKHIASGLYVSGLFTFTPAA